MNRENQVGETMKCRRQPAKLVVLAVLVLVGIISVAAMSAAQEQALPPAATRAKMVGPWTVTLVGNTGCGISSMLVTFNLDITGNGTATVKGHSTGCADNTTTGLPFQISTLNANGSGIAGLSCGAGCGWTFSIQAAANGKTFNLADITDAGNNILAGVAVHQ